MKILRLTIAAFLICIISKDFFTNNKKQQPNQQQPKKEEEASEANNKQEMRFLARRVSLDYGLHSRENLSKE